MLEIVILSLTAVLNLLLGLIVYIKNPQSATNRLFFMLTGSFVVWSIVNHISVHPVWLSQLTWIRLVLFCGAFLNLSVFLTFLAFPLVKMTPDQRQKARLATITTASVMLLTLTPLVFKSLKVTNGSASPVPNPGIALFLIQTVSLLGASIYILRKKYQMAHGIIKNQLRLVITGLVGTFVLIILANLVLVVAFNVIVLVPFGPSFTLIFSGAFAYAIIKHHLFDIRRVAALGLAYVLSIGFMAILYGGAIFGISSLFLGLNQTDKRAEIINTVLALLLAFSFQRIKLFFDRLSNRVFYKDAYNPQEFLDKLNQILVAEVDLEALLKNSINVIESNLKASYCAFSIRKTAYFPKRIIGGGARLKLDQAEADKISTAVTQFDQKVLVADFLQGTNTPLWRLMDEGEVAVVIRLSSNSQSDPKNRVGEILLGAKKSGDPYTTQDAKILEIIANELYIAVQNALRFEEITAINLTLQERINEATRRLRRTNAKLEALDETKDDFISMASHQLRTPLTSVKGYLSLVLEGDTGRITATQRKMLGQAFTSSQRMVYLIADLLNVSRLKTGKFVIETTPINLADLVSDELAQLTETAASRSLTLVYNKPSHFPNLMLDETKTRQVIMNFVDNAIYYTPAGGTITIELLDKQSTVELRVIDNGIGVPRSEQHHLFTKFYRAGNARKARPDGTGLGLFMAKKVIVAQGGALIFESTEGKGSVFGFTFSKSKLAAPTEAEPAKTQAL